MATVCLAQQNKRRQDKDPRYERQCKDEADASSVSPFAGISRLLSRLVSPAVEGGMVVDRENGGHGGLLVGASKFGSNLFQI